MAAQAEQESVGCGTDGLLQQELLAVSPKVFSLVAMTGHGRECEFISPPNPPVAKFAGRIANGHSLNPAHTNIAERQITACL